MVARAFRLIPRGTRRPAHRAAARGSRRSTTRRIARTGGPRPWPGAPRSSWAAAEEPSRELADEVLSADLSPFHTELVAVHVRHFLHQVVPPLGRHLVGP